MKVHIRDFNDHDADAHGVMRFAAAMSRKLSQKRIEGRGGWNKDGCTMAQLRKMLKDHIKKGDLVDIANFAMMIWNREYPFGLKWRK